jgi:hypothetical protein
VPFHQPYGRLPLQDKMENLLVIIFWQFPCFSLTVIFNFCFGSLFYWSLTGSLINKSDLNLDYQNIFLFATFGAVHLSFASK